MKPASGMMHIASVDPDVSGLSHGEESYAPVEGTTHVFEVPRGLGEHLVAFPHWRLPVAEDYSGEPSHAQLLAAAVGRPSGVEGRRSGHRPVLSPEELATLKAEIRAELLAEIRAAGLVLSAPASPETEQDEQDEEEDEEEDAEPTPAPRKSTPPRQQGPGRRR